MGRIDGSAIAAAVCVDAIYWYGVRSYSKMISVEDAVNSTFSVGKPDGTNFAFDTEETKQRFIGLVRHLLKLHKAFFDQYERAGMTAKVVKGLNYAMDRTPSPMCLIFHGLAEK